MALRPNSVGLKFEPGEKILIDRSLETAAGQLFGRIGNREGLLPSDPSFIQIQEYYI